MQDVRYSTPVKGLFDQSGHKPQVENHCFQMLIFTDSVCILYRKETKVIYILNTWKLLRPRASLRFVILQASLLRVMFEQIKQHTREMNSKSEGLVLGNEWSVYFISTSIYQLKLILSSRNIARYETYQGIDSHSYPVIFLTPPLPLTIISKDMSSKMFSPSFPVFHSTLLSWQ